MVVRGGTSFWPKLQRNDLHCSYHIASELRGANASCKWILFRAHLRSLVHNLHSLRCERRQSKELLSASSPVVIPESLVLPFFTASVDDDNPTPSNSQSTVPHPQCRMALPDLLRYRKKRIHQVSKVSSGSHSPIILLKSWKIQPSRRWPRM
jgi:hypothetical protein